MLPYLDVPHISDSGFSKTLWRRTGWNANFRNIIYMDKCVMMVVLYELSKSGTISINYRS